MQLNRSAGVAVMPGMQSYPGPFNVFAANGIKPELVADFASYNEFFGYGGAVATFSDMFTVSTTDLETMTDSDGLRKWNAHNLCPYSENIGATNWIVSYGTVPVEGATATLVEDAASVIPSLRQTSVSFKTGELYTVQAEIKPNGRTNMRITVDVSAFPTGNSAWFDLDTGTVGLKEAGILTSSIEPTTDGFYLCTITALADATFTGSIYLVVTAVEGGGFYTGDGVSGMIFRKPRVYRSDLGGMVDNPDNPGSKYVPTEASEVYLPRRNAHLYDASVAKWNAHNLVTRSQELDNTTPWVRSALGGVTANATTAPDGTLTADQLVESSSGVVPHRFNTASLGAAVPAGERYTAAFYAKDDGSGRAACPSVLNGSDFLLNTIDLSDGSVTSTLDALGISFANRAISVTDVGDGWYLIALSFDLLRVGLQLIHGLADGTSNSYAGDGASGAYMWGMQVYRSDLNGVVANGDIGTYVATTATAVEPTLNTVSFPKKGLRFESAAATNLEADSNDFSLWANTNTTDTADAATSPDGTTNATELTASAITGLPVLQNTVTASGLTTHTHSIFVKAGTWTNWALIYDALNSNTGVWINLTTGAKGAADQASVTSSTTEDVGNGWHRVSVTYVVAGTTPCAPVVAFADADLGVSATFAGTETMFLYGHQFEAGSVPSSYIPTSGATVTRAAETLSIAGAKTPANTTAMSFAFKGLATYADEGYAASPSAGGGQFIPVLWKTNSSEYIEIVCVSSAANTGAFGARQETAAIFDEVYNVSDQLTPGINRAVNVASRNTSGAINLAKDGTASTANTTPTALSDLSAQALQLGPTSSDGGVYNGFISTVIMWGADIGDTGIAEAST
jgi:hypothetical protein